jgi:hypothetical protein
MNCSVFGAETHGTRRTQWVIVVEKMPARKVHPLPVFLSVENRVFRKMSLS